MNIEELTKREGKLHKIRPLPRRITMEGQQLESLDDDWYLSKVDKAKKMVELTNNATGHLLVLGPDNIREFRTPNFLLLRCDVILHGAKVTIEPHLMPAKEQPQDEGTSISLRSIDDKNFLLTLDGCIALAFRAAELGPTSPKFALAAVPMNPEVEMKTLFSSRETDVVKLIENPPRLRRGGFSLDAGDSARIVEAKLRRAVIPHHTIIDLWRDGTLIFAAPGDASFLS